MFTKVAYTLQSAIPKFPLLLYKPHALGLLHEQFHKGSALVLHLIVQHRVLKALFKCSHLTAGLEVEHLHNLVAVNHGLEQPLVVTLLQVGNSQGTDACAPGSCS